MNICVCLVAKKTSVLIFYKSYILLYFSRIHRKQLHIYGQIKIYIYLLNAQSFRIKASATCINVNAHILKAGTYYKEKYMLTWYILKSILNDFIWFTWNCAWFVTECMFYNIHD